MATTRKQSLRSAKSKPTKKSAHDRVKALIIPKSLDSWINVEEETVTSTLVQKLETLAKKEGAILLLFAAPVVGKRITPIYRANPYIGLPEEMGMEYAVTNICSKIHGRRKLLLVIHSNGGAVDSSYKIARLLRRKFEDITIFIPNVAASGATLITLTGNKIVMGEMANLTPIDIQLSYNGIRVSVNSITQSLRRLEDYFKDKLPEEAPYPYRAMAEKIDPLMLEEWSDYSEEIWVYLMEILRGAGYTDEKKRIDLAIKIIFSKYPHDFVITRERAKQYGIKALSHKPKDIDILNIMREWLSEYLMKSDTTHHIRYVLPKS